MTKMYAAYGSNMDLDQMAYRCPEALLTARGEIKDWRLLFKGSKTGCYATIEPCKGETVPVLLWEVSEKDEANLDRYEGFPTFYHKEDVMVETGFGPIQAMVYVMDSSRKRGLPSAWYYEVIEDAYRRFGFDTAVLEKALELSAR